MRGDVARRLVRLLASASLAPGSARALDPPVRALVPRLVAVAVSRLYHYFRGDGPRLCGAAAGVAPSLRGHPPRRADARATGPAFWASAAPTAGRGGAHLAPRLAPPRRVCRPLLLPLRGAAQRRARRAHAGRCWRRRCAGVRRGRSDAGWGWRRGRRGSGLPTVDGDPAVRHGVQGAGRGATAFRRPWALGNERRAWPRERGARQGTRWCRSPTSCGTRFRTACVGCTWTRTRRSAAASSARNGARRSCSRTMAASPARSTAGIFVFFCEHGDVIGALAAAAPFAVLRRGSRGQGG